MAAAKESKGRGKASRRRTTSRRRGAASIQRERAKRTRARAARAQASRKGWDTRQDKARFRALGHKLGGINGRRYQDWEFLNEMIRNNDPRWLKYYRYMREAGFSERSIYDRWFTP